MGGGTGTGGRTWPVAQEGEVIVRRSDLKHLLDVYIENGMVETEDEPIINRLWSVVFEAGTTVEGALKDLLDQQLEATVERLDSKDVMRFHRPSYEVLYETPRQG